MDARKPAHLKIYDPQSGKPRDLDRLIERLGTLAVAQQFGVSITTVERWRKGIHRPSRRTISRSQKNLF